MMAYNYLGAMPTYYQPNYMRAPQPYQQNQNGIIWVQGEEGAKAYMVAAGNSVLLMDSEASAFHLKSTDASGMPMPLRVFDYTERTAAPKTPMTGLSAPGGEFGQNRRPDGQGGGE